MSDLIRQSVSWPYVHGARSYSRVTQLASSPAAGSSEKTEETDRPKAPKAESGESEPATATTRRGARLDLSI
ncbi:hypothetical protein H261_18532 [Paramagnetospirillum caucaseum]|uniref:Uncharacterized protein n=1 Tax=Paramagnetospirillum caucaseum TaxID=1244869 RepID=M3A6K2_9PROT|nr:hypothetical protein [Paramagnetospirillum caucaseum]EME68438.1 hypothetical protein H261_18532 [Paramagnetospirillum caucaseum]